MWYVIQTKSGDEHDLMTLLQAVEDRTLYERCFIPLYEEVRRSGGRCRISFLKMFPGYLFIRTDHPEDIARTLRRLPEFARVLGAEEEDGLMTYIPVGSDDEAFLQSILEEGVMHVSYIRMRNKRIDEVVGPLAGYRNHIAKLDIPNRRAIVETEVFGKKRRIRFGLWLDGDPALPWLERRKGTEHAQALDPQAVPDIGIYPGDRVTDATGIYGDQIFHVKRVDPVHRTVFVEIDIFAQQLEIGLDADQVRKV